MSENTECSTKARKRIFSLREKMLAIERVQSGETKASVGRSMGVPESTLRGWCKSEHKIRGMARNSITPDSEVGSPASSSGAAQIPIAAPAMSSEDEAPVGPNSKRMKINESTSGIHDSENNASNNIDSGKILQTKMDYSSIFNNFLANGVQPNPNALLLHQLGFLTSQNAVNLLAMSGNAINNMNGMNNINGIPNLNGITAAHLAGPSPTVGLVENGLQYTKSSSHHKRSCPATITSAIAPTSQYDSANKSGSRKSLPPAAEAPTTPVPASPRKTSDHYNGGSYNQHQHNYSTSSSRSSRKDTYTHGKINEAFLLWLSQSSHQPLGRVTLETLMKNPNFANESWFWNWYKYCNELFAAGAAPSFTTTPGQSQTSTNKSPTKIKASLDRILDNSNNEKVKRSLNLSSINGHSTFNGTTEGEEETEFTMTAEEALEHGNLFFKYLDRCSVPTVTQLQVMQFKLLLDNLKDRGTKTTTFKHSRK